MRGLSWVVSKAKAKPQKRELRPPSGPLVRQLDRTDALLATLILIWGTAFPGLKVLGEVLDPYQMTWFRYAPFPVLYGIWLATNRRRFFAQVTGKHWMLMAALGALAVIGYHFPLNWGLHDSGDGVAVTAATGAILVATSPLWTLLISAATGHERLNLAALIGSLVAFVGVLVVVFLGRGHVEFVLARKALIVLLAPLCWATYSIYSRPLIQRYGGLFVTGVTMSLGTLMLLPLGIAYGTAPLTALEPRHWAWLLFLAILSTALGYAMWNHALKSRSASEVAVYVYFNPVVATFVGWLFLREEVTAWFLAGSALVMAGVILVNRARVQAAQAGPPLPGGVVAKP